MRDAGHDESDALLSKMQAEVEDVYRTAQKDLQKKIDDYVGKFAKDDAKKQKLVANGKMSQEDYEAWKQKTMLTGKQYRQMLNTVSTDLTNADKIARSIINGYTPEAYAVGMNYGTYQIESGTTFNTNFTLYNRETVERLLRDDPQLLPMPKVNIPKDKAWNYKHIKSAVTQGIIQGESMPKIAKRLENVVGMDKRAAIRNARTAVNGAENAGRMDSFYRAKEMGIGVKKQWLATPDGRTRDSHVEIDLEVVELEENFSNGCEYPGDPGGDPAEVYNCRCAMIPWLDRFGDKFDGERAMNLHGMTYDEWKGSHAKAIDDESIVTVFDMRGMSEEKASAHEDAIRNLSAEYPLRNSNLESAVSFRYAYNIDGDIDILDFVDENQEWDGVDAIFYPRTTKAPDGIELHGAHIVFFNSEDADLMSMKDWLNYLAETRERNPWSSSKDNFFNATGGVESIIAHEYAHALAHDCGMYFGEEHYAELKAIFDKYSSEEIGRQISNYATTNPEEMFAEAFVLSHDDRLRTPIVDEVMSLFKRLRG